MNIKYIDIHKIKPYENNPRNNEDAIDEVANSINNFGFQQPIVVDKNLVVIVGHTRLEASKQLKLAKVPVVIADDLGEQQVKAYRLADNKTNELASWDFLKLDDELNNINDFNMEDFGFDINFNVIGNDFNDEQENEEELEEDTPVIEEIDIKKGDLFQLGNHRLMCGDATNKEDVQKIMGGN